MKWTVPKPNLLFGAEVYGIRKAITNAMQVQTNHTFPVVAGMGEKGTVSNVALWRELGIPPIYLRQRSREKGQSAPLIVGLPPSFRWNF